LTKYASERKAFQAKAIDKNKKHICPIPFFHKSSVSQISEQRDYYEHTSKLAYSAINHDHLNIITVKKCFS
jgi:hypothetical protein